MSDLTAATIDEGAVIRIEDSALSARTRLKTVSRAKNAVTETCRAIDARRAVGLNC